MDKLNPTPIPTLTLTPTPTPTPTLTLTPSPLLLANGQQNTSVDVQTRRGSFETLQMDVVVVDSTPYITTEDDEQQTSLLNENTKQFNPVECGDTSNQNIHKDKEVENCLTRLWYKVKEHPLMVAAIVGVPAYALGAGTSYLMCNNNDANTGASSLARLDSTVAPLGSEVVTTNGKGHPQSIGAKQTVTNSMFTVKYEFADWDNIGVRNKFSSYSDEVKKILKVLNSAVSDIKIQKGLNDPVSPLQNRVRLLDEYTSEINYKSSSYERNLRQETQKIFGEISEILSGKEIVDFMLNIKPHSDKIKQFNIDFQSLLDDTNQQMLESMSFLTPEKFVEYNKGSELSFRFKAECKKIFSGYFADYFKLFNHIEQIKNSLATKAYATFEKIQNIYESMGDDILHSIIKNSESEIRNNNHRNAAGVEVVDVNSISHTKIQNELLPVFNSLCQLQHENHIPELDNILYDKQIQLIKALQSIPTGRQHDNRYKERYIADTNKHFQNLKKPVVTDAPLISCIDESMQSSHDTFLESVNKTVTNLVNGIIKNLSEFYRVPDISKADDKGDDKINSNYNSFKDIADDGMATKEKPPTIPKSSFNIRYATNQAKEKINKLMKQDTTDCKSTAEQEHRLTAQYGGTSHEVIKDELQSTLEKEVNEKINYMVDDLHDEVFSAERILRAKPVSST